MRQLRLPRSGRYTVIVLFLLLLHGARSAAATWREVQSPHFRVLTDGTEREGRAVAREFEQMRAVIAVAFPKANLETGAPLLIVAIYEDDLKQLGSSFYKQRGQVAGEYLQGWERQYAMVRLDSFGEQNQAVVFHEYTHSILHANLHWLPTWLDEGMAEFYGYTRFRDDVTVGSPSLRMEHLQHATLLSIPQMFEGPEKLYKNDEQMDVFYGEAWAMVHYMTFGPNMGRGAKLNAFIAALQTGTSQEQAFEQIFGDQKQFMDKLYTYAMSASLNGILLKDLQVPDAKTYQAKILTVAETDYGLGSVDIGAHLFPEGKARMEAAVAADPKLAGPHEELGFLAWGEGHDPEARAEWQKAVSIDANSYRSAFALLMSGTPVQEQSVEQLEATQQALETLHTTAPKFAPVLVELAIVKWRLGKMLPAFKDSLAAETLEPWRAEYRLLTAQILLQGNQPKLAAKYARLVADRWRGPDHDEAVEVWNRVPAEARDDGPALKFSFGENATVVRGTILSTSCEKGVSVVVKPAGEGKAPVTVTSAGPFESGFADTLWVGEDHYTPCYHLEGLPVVVAYKETDGAKRLLVLEVRDNLPNLQAVPVSKPIAEEKAVSAHP